MNLQRWRCTRTFVTLLGVAAVSSHVSAASAAICTFSFPTFNDTDDGPRLCQQGSSKAYVAHFLTAGQGFSLYVDFASGSSVALAYPIDENGNHLNTVETTVGDDDKRYERFSPVDAQTVYGVPGTLTNHIFYDYFTDIASTYVVVF